MNSKDEELKCNFPNSNSSKKISPSPLNFKN